MKNKNNEFIGNTELMSEMANIVQVKSGLPMNIWISQCYTNLSPRIMAQSNHEQKLNKSHYFIVTLDDEIIGNTGDIKSNEIEKLLTYIELNRKEILKYWYNEIDDTEEVLNSLKTIA